MAAPLINNQALFSLPQIVELKNRLVNGPFKEDLGGDLGDFNHMIAEATAFDANPSANRYNNMFSGTSPIPNSSIYAPFPAAPSNTSDNIHYAAIYAFLTDNNSIAQKVIDQIIIRANDDDLDFGNGTTKVNSTHGTTIRYFQGNTAVNPWLFVGTKMVKYLESYALVQNLVTISSANRDRLDQWFFDANLFFIGKTNTAMNVTHDNDWETENYRTTNYNQVLQNNNSRRNPAYTDSAGNVITPTVTLSQQTGLNNTKSSFTGYVHAYGIYYNNQESLDHSFSWFKAHMYFNIYPDGTTGEIVRSYPANDDLGVRYGWTATTEIIKSAHLTYIANINGFPSAPDGGEYYDFTTSLGTDDFTGFSNYVGTSTSGGPKNIKNLILALAKYHQQFNNGVGWTPNRYFEGTLLTMNSYMFHRSPAAMANIYYKDQEIEDLYKMVFSRGYQPPQRSSTGGTDGGAWSEPSFGIFGIPLAYGLWAEMEDIVNVVNIPVITVTGNTTVYILQNDPYTEMGAVWVDVEDGMGAAIVGGDTVNTSTLGQYIVRYNFTDSDGNAAIEKTRVVNVVTEIPLNTSPGISRNLLYVL